MYKEATSFLNVYLFQFFMKIFVLNTTFSKPFFLEKGKEYQKMNVKAIFELYNICSIILLKVIRFPEQPYFRAK